MALLRFCCAAIVLAAMALPWGSPAHALAAAPTEYQVKAAFLFNFTQFVDWPPSAFADDGAPLVIGVLGQDRFGADLDEIVRGESVRGRPLVVRRYERVEDIGPCHILFVDRSESERLDRVLPRLSGRSILTVGEFGGFARRGGMIQFATVGNRIQLRVNLQAARAADLEISSKLLRPARIVTSGED